MAGAQLCNQQSLSTWHTKCCTRKLERKRLMPSDGGSPSHHMLRNGRGRMRAHSCSLQPCEPKVMCPELFAALNESSIHRWSQPRPLLAEVRQEHMAVLLHNIVKHGIRRLPRFFARECYTMTDYLSNSRQRGSSFERLPVSVELLLSPFFLLFFPFFLFFSFF